jgi:AbrB family looped-hinge helix DNA binding protein
MGRRKCVFVGRVQERGQVTVPRRIREACGIRPGTELTFVQTGPDRFECHVLPDESITEVLKRYASPGVAPDLDALRAEIGDELAETYRSDLSSS